MSEDLFTCAICIERLVEPVVVTPCAHRFCRRCYDDCRRASAACPMCRRGMTGGFRDRMMCEIMAAFDALQLRATRAEQNLVRERARQVVADERRREQADIEADAALAKQLASEWERANDGVSTEDDDCSSYYTYAEEESQPSDVYSEQQTESEEEDDETRKARAYQARDTRFREHWSLPESQYRYNKCERCRYFPNCDREDNCNYVHPTVPCRGDCVEGARTCLYLHTCRLGPTRCNMDACYLMHDEDVEFSEDEDGLCIDNERCEVVGCDKPHNKCRYGRRCFNLRDDIECDYYHPPGTEYRGPRRYW